MKKILITLIALVAVIPMWAQSYSKDLEKAAKKGDVEAMYQLGMALLNGDGIKKDTKKASEWFKKAMEKGSDEAADAFYSFESKERDKLYKKFDIAPGMEFEGYLSYGGPFVIRINTSEKDSIVGKVHSYDKTTGALKAEGKVGFRLLYADFFRKYIVEGKFTMTTTYSHGMNKYNNLVEFGKKYSKGDEAHVTTNMLYTDLCEVTSYLEHPALNRHPNDNTLEGTKSYCMGVNLVYTQRAEIGESKFSWDMGGAIPTFTPWGNGQFNVNNQDNYKQLYDILRPVFDDILIKGTVKTIDRNLFPPSYTDADIQKIVEKIYSDLNTQCKNGYDGISSYSSLARYLDAFASSEDYMYKLRNEAERIDSTYYVFGKLYDKDSRIKEEMLGNIVPIMQEYVNDENLIKEINEMINATGCYTKLVEVPMDSLSSNISKYLPEALRTNPKYYCCEKFDNNPTEVFVSYIILNNGAYFLENQTKSNQLCHEVVYLDSLTEVNSAYNINQESNPYSSTIKKKFKDGTTFELNYSYYKIEKIKYPNNDSLVNFRHRLSFEEIFDLAYSNNKQDYDNFFKAKFANDADVKEVSKKIIKPYESKNKIGLGDNQEILDIYNDRHDIEVLFNGKKYYNLHDFLLTAEQLRVAVDNASAQIKKLKSTQSNKIYQKNCAKYGKKYVDALNNNTLIKGMPLSMLIDLSNLSHITTWDNRYSCYYICNGIGQILYKAWFTDGKLTDWVKY